MKTVVEREVIPPDPEPTVIETTWYVCEEPGCEFRTQDEDEMSQHHGKTHAVRGTIEVEGLKAVRFDTEQDANAYGETYGAERHEVHWQGPGWYTVVCRTERCRRGCCTDWVAYVVTVESKMNEIREEGRAKLRTFLRMRNALREQGVDNV